MVNTRNLELEGKKVFNEDISEYELIIGEQMREYTVLSLFDGMSCGQLALKSDNKKVKKYYASEIMPIPMMVTNHNFADTIQVGDVKNIDVSKLDKIDLLIGGSPCTSLSFCGKEAGLEASDLDSYLEMKKQNVQFQGQSVLFWEYVRILREIQKINPNVKFLLENVRMKPMWRDQISSELGVSPIEINSNLVSAQNRWRQYWTNIDVKDLPTDKCIMLEDMVHETVDNMPAEYLEKYKVPFDESLQIFDEVIKIKKRKIGYFRTDSQANRVYSIHDKAITLTGESGGGAAKMGQYLFGCITPNRIKKRQDGQGFNDGDKFYTLTIQDRHGILIDGYIRKLTPIECCRLQTIPEDYVDIEGVSEPQKYKMLGNGWTVDVISHIFSYLE